MESRKRKYERCNLSQIISGNKPGRTSRESITVFDSTGVAIEDISIAGLIYNKAHSSGRYPYVDIVEKRKIPRVNIILTGYIGGAKKELLTSVFFNEMRLILPL